MDCGCSDDDISRRDIDIPVMDDKHNALSGRSSLVYDGNMKIFLGDYYNKAVHVLAMDGRYNCKITLSRYITGKMLKLSEDQERHLLFVGQEFSDVTVFQLIYENCKD